MLNEFPTYTLTKDKSEGILTEVFRCYVPYYNILVEVNKGFSFNGSYPRCLEFILGDTVTNKKTQVGFLIHDLLYQGRFFPRKVNDDIFLVLLKAYGCNWFLRNTKWLAVRAFGGRVYSQHTLSSITHGRQYGGIILMGGSRIKPQDLPIAIMEHEILRG